MKIPRYLLSFTRHFSRRIGCPVQKVDNCTARRVIVRAPLDTRRAHASAHQMHSRDRTMRATDRCTNNNTRAHASDREPRRREAPRWASESSDDAPPTLAPRVRVRKFREERDNDLCRVWRCRALFLLRIFPDRRGSLSLSCPSRESRTRVDRGVESWGSRYAW